MNKTIAKVTHLVQLAAIGIAATSLSLVSAVPPSLAATAPSCVELAHSKEVISLAPDKVVAKATNDCSGTQRFRMIWAWAGDGSCRSIGPGGSFTEKRPIGSPPLPYVNELRKC